MNTHRFTLAAVAVSAAMVMSACGGGGASDTVGDSAAAEAPAGAEGGTVNLFAYAVPKVGYDKLIPAFQASEAGKGVQFHLPTPPRTTAATARNSGDSDRNSRK